jgi:hypothetical protein
MQSFGKRPAPACSPLSCFLRRSLFAALVALVLTAPGYVLAQEKSASGAPVSKALGVIKSIQGDSITVAAESGGDVTAKLLGTTKILRVPPGEKDLKNATALQLQDLQPGDRVLVRGQASPDGDAHAMVALAVIVMKQADVAARHQHERDDWQKRGVDGLVTKVDSGAGIITISTGGVAASRSIAVHVAKDTILRRYAPGSVKFDDAKPAPASQIMAQIKPGDQLRARGTRSADGSELSAEEVVSGTFRNIAGTIKAIDAANSTMTVQDAIAKTAVVVKMSSDSQMKKLPPEMAQRIAMRLKSAGGAAAGGSGEQPSANAPSPSGNAANVPGGPQGAGGPGRNGPPDLQRMLSRLPNATLADMQKGDAVMVLATEGGSQDGVTAITLLAGVEAILTAAPNRSASTLLSPWSLNTQGGEGDAASQ